jgi:hypothetical protein
MVARSRASAIFYPGEGFSLSYAPPEGEPFQLGFATTYQEAGFDVPLPMDFCVEARGTARDIHSAGELFGNAALEISSYIALTANASMGHLEPHLIFDATPAVTEHEFLQSFLPDQPVAAVPGRRIDIELLHRVVQSLATHPERERLGRATVQYVEALRSWRPAHEITCLAHLYMGVECVTKAVLRQYLRSTGKDEEQLAVEWQVNDTDKLKRRKGIDREARLRLVFRGDKQCADKARAVSDGFEHGYSDFGSMRKPAQEIIVKTAAYLRQAILEATGIELRLLERALGPQYSVPRGPLMLVRYLRGTLTGAVEELAAEGELYPIFFWRGGLQKVQLGEDGVYQFTPNDTFTAKLGAGVQLSRIRYEVWDGSKIVEQDAPLETPNQNSRF